MGQRLLVGAAIVGAFVVWDLWANDLQVTNGLLRELRDGLSWILVQGK